MPTVPTKATLFALACGMLVCAWTLTASGGSASRLEATPVSRVDVGYANTDPRTKVHHRGDSQLQPRPRFGRLVN